MYAEFCLIYLRIFSNDFLQSILKHSFFIKIFWYKIQIWSFQKAVKRSRVKNFLYTQPWRAVFKISFAYLFSLGKLTNHFLKVKSNPGNYSVFSSKSFSLQSSATEISTSSTMNVFVFFSIILYLHSTINVWGWQFLHDL